MSHELRICKKRPHLIAAQPASGVNHYEGHKAFAASAAADSNIDHDLSPGVNKYCMWFSRFLMPIALCWKPLHHIRRLRRELPETPPQPKYASTSPLLPGQ